MILPEDEEWLAHYGVKGMKWGVRKERRASKKRAEKQRRSTMTAAQKRADTNKKKAKRVAQTHAGILLLGSAARIAILVAPFASKKVNAYKQNARDKKVVSDILERNGMTLLKKKKGVVYNPGYGPKPGTFPNATDFVRSMDKNRKMLNP